MQEFPAIFDGQMREKFHVIVIRRAVSFCVKTLQSVPFVYNSRAGVASGTRH